MEGFSIKERTRANGFEPVLVFGSSDWVRSIMVNCKLNHAQFSCVSLVLGGSMIRIVTYIQISKLQQALLSYCVMGNCFSVAVV